MRKVGSTFDNIVKYLNSLPIGTITTNGDVIKNCKMPGHRYRDINRLVCNYLTGLTFCQALSRPSRGHYKIEAHIPDFVTVAILEATRGVKRYVGEYPTGKYEVVGTPWHADLSRSENQPIQVEQSEGRIQRDQHLKPQYELNMEIERDLTPMLERLSGLIDTKDLCAEDYKGQKKTAYHIASYGKMEILAYIVPIHHKNIKHFDNLKDAVDSIAMIDAVHPEEVIEFILERNDREASESEKEFHKTKVLDNVKFTEKESVAGKTLEEPDLFFDGRNDHLKDTEWYKEQVEMRNKLKQPSPAPDVKEEFEHLDNSQIAQLKTLEVKQLQNLSNSLRQELNERNIELDQKTIMADQIIKELKIANKKLEKRIENNIGKEIFYLVNGVPQKDVIDGYKLKFVKGMNSDQAPIMIDITTESGEEFIDESEFFYSKQELIESVAKIINEL